MTDASIESVSPTRARVGLGESLISIVILGFVNAEYIRLSRAIEQNGIWNSVYGTFGISVIVWLSLLAIINLLSRTEFVAVSKRDAIVIVASSALFFVPVTALSGIALTLIGAYFSIWGETDRIRRAMRIQVALTMAMLWARVSFSFLLPYILPGDAALVSLLTGLVRHGNIVLAADKATQLQVGAGCSSFLNLTTAALGWATAVAYFGVRVTLNRILLLLGSCVAIIGINTLRIGLIGWFPQQFELVHGYVGANVANIISSASIFFFSWAAIKGSNGRPACRS
jgi:hypothetical protein